MYNFCLWLKSKKKRNFFTSISFSLLLPKREKNFLFFSFVTHFCNNVQPYLELFKLLPAYRRPAKKLFTQLFAHKQYFSSILYVFFSLLVCSLELRKSRKYIINIDVCSWYLIWLFSLQFFLAPSNSHKFCV